MADTSTAIASSTQGSTLVVTLLPEQLRDLALVQQLKQEMLQALEAAHVANVILDFSNVRFVGSVAFLAFLGVRRQAGVSRVVLTGLDVNLREVFSLCRLIPTVNSPTAPFEEAASMPEALARCGEL
jgi:anti-anti-sigma factor